jgi:transcriptional regulator with XRE-family HTH domain
MDITSHITRKFSGTLLKSLREAKGWTINKLLVRFATVVGALPSEVTYRRWENCETVPSLQHFLALLDVLDCPPQDLLVAEEPKPNEEVS